MKVDMDKLEKGAVSEETNVPEDAAFGMALYIDPWKAAACFFGCLAFFSIMTAFRLAGKIPVKERYGGKR